MDSFIGIRERLRRNNPWKLSRTKKAKKSNSKILMKRKKNKKQIKIKGRRLSSISRKKAKPIESSPANHKIL